MDGPRHQCLIYHGSPARQLPGLAGFISQQLKAKRRCLCLNSPPMIAGIRSYLFAAGVDVEAETRKGALVLSSSQDHLVDGGFDSDRMIELLLGAMDQARSDGFEGLWATGDMSWELGHQRNHPKLFDYECRLEEALKQNPCLSGICQYHVDTLPTVLLRGALRTHQGVYLNDTLSHMNPNYDPKSASLLDSTDFDDMLGRVRAASA